jgi:cAMP phosphodiesterase
MKVQLLGSSVHDPARRQYVTSYLINGTVAIDAGCLGFHETPQEQEKVRHVFLTHSHADHTASLPIFTENAWTPDGECPRIYGSPETLDSVHRHIFNEVMWPDFVALSEKMHPLVPVEAGGLWITPVPVNHVVPSLAILFVTERVQSFSPAIQARPHDCGNWRIRLRIFEPSFWRRRFRIR